MVVSKTDINRTLLRPVVREELFARVIFALPLNERVIQFKYFIFCLAKNLKKEGNICRRMELPDENPIVFD